AFHPQNEKTIYFSDKKSTDGGITFHEYALRPDGIGILQVVVSPSNGETVYLRTDRSLYRSTNGGDTWSKLPIHTPNVLQTLLVAPSNPNILYMGSFDGVYTSSNAGASWVHYGKNSGVLDPVAVDPANPLAVFAIYYGFLRLSTDAGKSFTKFDMSGLPADVNLSSGVLDTLNPRTLHLATSNGIYSYTHP
ncbi:MAG TPA: hypothetical protein VLR94_00985, partial [Acidobacteriota bacterium]|nr:hypothetical protein [Acidobacteriota bacterium]